MSEHACKSVDAVGSNDHEHVDQQPVLGVEDSLYVVEAGADACYF